MTRFACLALLSACAAGSTDDASIDELAAAAPANPDTIVASYCPDVSATGITTYRGLAGSYQRTSQGVLDEPVRIYFAPARDDPDANGWYSATRTTSGAFDSFVAGKFMAIPDNPAIGAALGLDTNGDTKIDQTFFVLGVARTTRITALCLVGADHPFELKRAF